MSKFYLFYEKRGRSTSRYISSKETLSSAISFGEQLYKLGYRDIKIRETNSNKSIEKVIYRVFYKENNIPKMTSLITYSCMNVDVRTQISLLMDSLNVSTYSIKTIPFEKWLEIEDRARREKDTNYLKTERKYSDGYPF